MQTDSSAPRDRTGQRLALDEAGKRYGRLRVLGRAPNMKQYAAWECVCDCGTRTSVRGQCLRSGNTASCGCARRERFVNTLTKSVSPMDAAYNRIIDVTKRNARTRNYEWRLTREEALGLLTGACHYCGCPPARMARSARGAFAYNGIDRVDNAKGYLTENVVSCCADCNSGKRTMTKDEFLAWIARVYDHSVQGK